MITAVILAATLIGPAPRDTLPVVTLREALQQAVQLDPNYVQSVGFLSNAEAARRTALLVFVLPSVTASADYSELSTKQFNIGTGSAANATGRAAIDARYELFTGGRKIAEAKRTAADVESNLAGELGARFEAALQVERDYYIVLGVRELAEVARQRLARAREGLVTARARVVSGATVQSDSLQVLLEVQRAEVDVLRTEAQLVVAQLQLGRRIGRGTAVDAAPLDSLMPPELPLTLGDAVMQALAQGPAWRQVRANERSAAMQLRARQASYFPTVTLAGSVAKFDDKFFPTETTRRSVGFGISLPIWDGGQRELAITRLKSSRDLSRAIREDLENAARHDVTEAYSNYDVSRQTFAISLTAVTVAAEILRVQASRYRVGAALVLELLDAQSQLVQTQADLVQARYGVRLARAALETILGARLTNDPDRSIP